MTMAISAAVGSPLWLMAILLSLKMAALYTFAVGRGEERAIPRNPPLPICYRPQL